MNSFRSLVRRRIRQLLIDNWLELENEIGQLYCEKCHLNLMISRLIYSQLANQSVVQSIIEKDAQYGGYFIIRHKCPLCNYNIDITWTFSVKNHCLNLRTFTHTLKYYISKPCFLSLNFSNDDIKILDYVLKVNLETQKRLLESQFIEDEVDVHF